MPRLDVFADVVAAVEVGVRGWDWAQPTFAVLAGGSFFIGGIVADITVAPRSRNGAVATSGTTHFP